MGSEGLSQMIANEVSSSGFMPDFAYQMSVTIWFEPPTYRLRAEILSYLKVFGLSKRYN